MLENEDYAKHLRRTRAPTPTSHRRCRPRGRCSRTTTRPATRATTTTSRSSPASRPNPDNQADCQLIQRIHPPGHPVRTASRKATAACIRSAIQNIGTQLSAHGLNWKGYEEDMGNDPSRESAACGHPALNSKDETQDSRRRRRLRDAPRPVRVLRVGDRQPDLLRRTRRRAGLAERSDAGQRAAGRDRARDRPAQGHDDADAARSSRRTCATTGTTTRAKTSRAAPRRSPTSTLPRNLGAEDHELAGVPQERAARDHLR